MIGIIGAMTKEVDDLVATLAHPTTKTLLGVTFHEGSLAGEEVVVACAGVGKVNAALTAGAMLLTYRPSLLLNTGVAGALDPTLRQGDIVLATSLVQHDMDTTPLGEPRGLLNIRGEELVEIPTDPTALAMMSRACASLGITPRTGLIATGDCFVASREQKETILSAFPALACEMEGAAIAHAAYAAGVPCGVLRAISDGADEQAKLDFPTFARQSAELSQKILLTFLTEYRKQSL